MYCVNVSIASKFGTSYSWFLFISRIVLRFSFDSMILMSHTIYFYLNGTKCKYPRLSYVHGRTTSDLFVSKYRYEIGL